MTIRTTTILGATVAAAALHAAGQSMPQMGGPMLHAYIAHEAGTLSAAMDSDEPVELFSYDATYEGNASVLTGTMYSARYGWLADFIDPLPVELTVIVEQLDATPGLRIYEGGMMMNMGQMTFAPIFGTDGSPAEWAWNRRMVHNWYAVDAPGSYEATYRVFVRDPDGVELTSYGSPTYTFRFIARGPDCAADLDGDGAATIFDILAFFDLFASTAPGADVTGEGDVDIFDILAFFDAFAAC